MEEGNQVADENIFIQSPPSLSSSSCDFRNDNCPWRMDGECDDITSDYGSVDIPDCYGGDCFDCDPCQVYSGTDCLTCITNDCQWCSESKACSGIPLDQSYFNQISTGLIGCNDPTSWTTTTCTSEDDQESQRVSDNDVPVPVSLSTCDFENDGCPLKWQADGQCDDIYADRNSFDIPACYGGDCFDCDPCHQFMGDCDACIESNCFWCPGDGVCSQKPLDQLYFNRFEENITTACETKESWEQFQCRDETNIFPDPLFDAMEWMYRLMNVEPVWKQGIAGTGVTIRVNDNGVDANHPELSSRFSVAASCSRYMPVNNRAKHGTAIASIAAGGANNQCAVGIAPNATISACNMDHPRAPSIAEVLSDGVDMIDISTNSWGLPGCFDLGYYGRRLVDENQWKCPFRDDITGSPCLACSDFFSTGDSSPVCENAIIQYCLEKYEHDAYACADFLDLFVECDYNALSRENQDALTRGITEGREGKGIIYLFASGNEYGSGADANFDGWLNTRFTISVGAVDRFGKHSSYSTPGAALFISAPGGDNDYLSNNFVANPGGGCHDIGYGTSISCPAVAGVIALLLQVNPSLSWRDVQGVLASTARITDPTHTSWTTNAALYNHSYLYGFGLVDAHAAVTSARKWKSYGAEEVILVESGRVDMPIFDDHNRVTESKVNINMENDQIFITESVVVYLDLNHSSRGDLKVSLTSPGGTKSILHPGKRPEHQQIRKSERWKLMTVRAWGENPVGEWTLAIVDEKAGHISECVDLPWSVAVDNEEGDITCLSLAWDNLCRNGEGLHPSLFRIVDSNGYRPIDACCECGGGLPSPELAPVLQAWRLVVHGRFVSKDDNVRHLTPYGTSAKPTKSSILKVLQTSRANNTQSPKIPTSSGGNDLIVSNGTNLKLWTSYGVITLSFFTCFLIF